MHLRIVQGSVVGWAFPPPVAIFFPLLLSALSKCYGLAVNSNMTTYAVWRSSALVVSTMQLGLLGTDALLAADAVEGHGDAPPHGCYHWSLSVQTCAGFGILSRQPSDA